MGTLIQSGPQKFSTSQLFKLSFQAATSLATNSVAARTPSTTEGSETSRKKSLDLQIVQEFRTKLRTAEEMVSKLGFNLREIQELWKRPQSGSSENNESAAVISVGNARSPFE